MEFNNNENSETTGAEVQENEVSLEGKIYTMLEKVEVVNNRQVEVLEEIHDRLNAMLTRSSKKVEIKHDSNTDLTS